MERAGWSLFHPAPLVDAKKEQAMNQPAHKSLTQRLYRDRFLILMVIPAIAYYLIFCYLPMTGLVIAFKD
ncbi:MAG: hypothetical protein RSC68_25110, partial [Acinetobacter sp.]